MSPEIRSLLQEAAGPVTEIPDFDHIYGRSRRIRRLRRARMGAAVMAAAAVVVSVLMVKPFEFQARPPPASQEQGPPAQAVIEGTLLPGRYRSVEFRPRITFEVGRRWFVETDTRGRFSFLRGGIASFSSGEPRHLTLMNVQHVVDPATGDADRAPSDLAAWVRDHPLLRTTSVAQTSILGSSALVIDARVLKPRSFPRAMTPCLPISVGRDECVALLGPAPPERAISLPPGQAVRFIFPETENRRLAIILDTPPKLMRAFAMDAERVLSSITF